MENEDLKAGSVSREVSLGVMIVSTSSAWDCSWRQFVASVRGT